MKPRGGVGTLEDVSTTKGTPDDALRGKLWRSALLMRLNANYFEARLRFLILADRTLFACCIAAIGLVYVLLSAARDAAYGFVVVAVATTPLLSRLSREIVVHKLLLARYRRLVRGFESLFFAAEDGEPVNPADLAVLERLVADTTIEEVAYIGAPHEATLLKAEEAMHKWARAYAEQREAKDKPAAVSAGDLG